MNFSQNCLNVRISLVFVLQKILRTIIHEPLQKIAKTKIAEIGQTMKINKKEIKQNLPNVCTEFVLTLQGNTFECLPYLTQNIAKFYCAKFGKTRFETS